MPQLFVMVFTKASPSLAVASRWRDTTSLLPFVVPVCAAVTAGTGRTAAATTVVDVGVAVDISYIAGADDATVL